MKINLIVKPGYSDSGVGRYVDELASALTATGYEVIFTYPTVPLPEWLLSGIKRWPGWDLQSFLLNYPIWITYPPADIYHFSSQNLASLLFIRYPPGPTVVTVHDIIPLILKNNSELHTHNHFIRVLFDKLAMTGLRHAKHIITVSNHTRDTLVQYLHIAKNIITVIHEGV